MIITHTNKFCSWFLKIEVQFCFNYQTVNITVRCLCKRGQVCCNCNSMHARRVLCDTRNSSWDENTRTSHFLIYDESYTYYNLHAKCELPCSNDITDKLGVQILMVESLRPCPYHIIYRVTYLQLLVLVLSVRIVSAQRTVRMCY